MSSSRGKRTAVAALALAVVGLATHAWSRHTDGAVADRVVLLGVDGADWEVIDSLIDEGRLPHFARMKREGACGNLRSHEPIFSPVIWATIATGKGPDEHGIRGFTAPGPFGMRQVPVTSNMLRASPIWDILGRRGRTVGVVGWWTTWPARPVNGFLFSDRTWPITMGPEGWPVTSRGAKPLPQRTFPESLASAADPFLVTRHSLTEADLARVEVGGARAVVGSGGPSVADTYAKDLTFSRIAAAWFPEERPDFATLYLNLPDVAGHYFYDSWTETRARAAAGNRQEDADGKRDRMRAAAARTFEQSYEHADSVLGELLARADSGTLVMVVSDHGFGPNPEGRMLHAGDGLSAAPKSWHRLDGVILARGPGVRAGAWIDGARVQDVAPTILFAMGEPVGADMSGVVLSRLFDERIARRRIPYVPTHDTADAPLVTVPIQSSEDEAVNAQLRSLGYVR